MREIEKILENYKNLKDAKQKCSVIFKVANDFIKKCANKELTQEEYSIGLKLCRKLNDTRYIATLREFEFDDEIQDNISFRIIMIFKLLIPVHQKELKGLVEVVAGMQESELDGYEFVG